MIKPVQNFCNRMEFDPFGRFRPVDHDNWQTQGARRGDFCIGPCSTRIFRNDKINAVTRKKRAVSGFGKRATRQFHMTIGKWQRLGRRIHQPQQIVMLRLGGKRGQMHPADGQHHPFRGPPQGRHRSRNVGHMVPGVSGLRLPVRTGQCSKRNAGPRAGRSGIAAHLGGKGVRRVDNMGDPVVADIFLQALNATKTTEPDRQGLIPWGLDPTGQRNNTVATDIPQGPAQRGGIKRSAKDQKVFSHV